MAQRVEPQGSYQGYPYVNPPVTEPQNRDPTVAAMWTNLPRRQIQTIKKRDIPPQVYVNIPEEGASSVSQAQEDDDDEEESGDPRPRLHSNMKKNFDDNPVVYIDLPEDSSISTSSVTTSSRQDRNQDDFVQDTIFFDPFENRRIDVSSNSSLDSSRPGGSTASSRPPRPLPPAHLDFNGASSSGYSSMTPGSTNPSIPPFLSKETYVYGRQPTPDDGFSLTPLPLSEFPEPPPAYSEIDRITSPQPSVAESQTNLVQNDGPPELPRTQVITTNSEDSDRKYLQCHHCHQRGHTVIVRESGTATHVLAIFCMLFGLFPCTIGVYVTDYCKYKVHYCPNCNKKIGYEVPMLCQQMVYSE